MSELKGQREYQSEKDRKHREFDEQVKTQDLTVKDKEKASATAAEMRQEGTREGARNVRAAMEKAGEAIDAHMKKKESEFKTTAQEGKREEQEVGRASDAAKEDSRRAEKAAGSIETGEARSTIQEASRVAANDQQWLSDLRQSRERDREESEQKTRDQVQKVLSIRVKTSR